MSNEDIANKVKQLKIRVTQLVGEVNSLKKQLEQATISLPEFKQRKEKLQDELREILAKIAQYKEKVGISAATKKDTGLAEQARDLMYYFQTDFEETITKAKVYLSITLDTHFIFTIDYTNYPDRPIITTSSNITEKFSSMEDFLQKVPSYTNWDVNNPKKIYELVFEIETVLTNAYSADLQSIEEASIQYIEENKALIQRLIRKASTELQVKNIDTVIELYKSIIDLAYEIKDFKIVSDYTFKLDELLKIIRKNR
ncbi:MAG: hypothetical protein ACTSWR_07925 [Candidatus Helarchaeota archaeon]